MDHSPDRDFRSVDVGRCFFRPLWQFLTWKGGCPKILLLFNQLLLGNRTLDTPFLHCTNTVTLTQFLPWIQWQEQRVRNWKLVEEHIVGVKWGRNNSPLELILLQLSERAAAREGINGESTRRTSPAIQKRWTSVAAPQIPWLGIERAPVLTLFIPPRANSETGWKDGKRNETGLLLLGDLFSRLHVYVSGVGGAGVGSGRKWNSGYKSSCGIYRFSLPVMKIVINLWRVS